MTIDALLRNNVRDFEPYRSARSGQPFGPATVLLNANESSPIMPLALSSQYFNRYPEPQPAELVSSYAAYLGRDARHVLITRGADEGIALLIQAFCEPGTDAIAITPPTYGMYAISAKSFGVDVFEVPMQLPNFGVQWEVLQKLPAQTKLVFLCSPNNPLGTVLPLSKIAWLANQLRGRAILIIDEAYAEFSTTTSLALVDAFENIVVLRTLSKAFALAGLRIGCVIGQPCVIDALRPIMAPYPIPTPCAELAVQMLQPAGIATMKDNVKSIQEARAESAQWITAHTNFTLVTDSTANFILVRMPNKDEWLTYLARHGVMLREQSTQHGLADCVRISIGSADELNTLKQLIQTFPGRRSHT
jgi:histidinol-phosphate aminotransferase